MYLKLSTLMHNIRELLGHGPIAYADRETDEILTDQFSLVTTDCRRNRCRQDKSPLLDLQNASTLYITFSSQKKCRKACHSLACHQLFNTILTL